MAGCGKKMWRGQLRGVVVAEAVVERRLCAERRRHRQRFHAPVVARHNAEDSVEAEHVRVVAMVGEGVGEDAVVVVVDRL